MNRSSYNILLLPLIINIFMNFGCNKNNAPGDKEGIIKYTMVNYACSTFVSYDYEFEGNVLVFPLYMKKFNKVDDILIFDSRKPCIYIFSKDGIYLRSIGRRGQGPGEYLTIICIDIDNEDNIYIYDNANRRFSIFSYQGKLIGDFSFRPSLTVSSFFKFKITQNSEILINAPARDFYFTLLKKDGKIIRDIALIKNYRKRFDLNAFLAEGFPFQDNEGNYYIFLQHLPLVKKFNANGELIFERNFLDDFPEYKQPISSYLPPEESKSMSFSSFHADVMYKNGYFYKPVVKKEKTDIVELYEYDGNIKINKEYIVKLPQIYLFRMNAFRCELINDADEFLLSVPTLSYIYKCYNTNK